MADISGDGERLDAQFQAIARDVTRDNANEWHSKAIETLYQRADEEEFDVASVAQSSLPPEWDEAEGAWTFVFPHIAAPFLEFGTDEHPIEAKDAEVLAFEWPEMEGEPFGDTGKTWDEVYADTWPTVFLPEVEHPGTPALRFLTDSWKQVFDQ